MKMVLQRLNTESLRSTLPVIFTGCLIITVSSVLLYRTFTVSSYQGEGKQLGEMTYVEKTVKRRFSDQVLWETVEHRMAVYEGDYLQTRENSFASLKLFNGSVIEMDAESMIILTSGRKGAGINFRYGGIQAKAGKKGEGITLTSGSSTILLNKSNAALRGNSEKKVQLAVSNGSAEVVSGDKTYKLDNSQIATVEMKGSLIAVDEKPVEPLEPPDNYFSPVTDEKIKFTWRTNPPKQNTFLIIKSTSGQIIKRKTVRGKLEQSLQAGTWYWHLVSGTGKSLQRRLTIVALKSLQLVSPQNASLLSAESDDLISFNWKGNKKGEVYRLRIEPAEGSQRTAKETRTVSAGIAMEKIPDGRYRWQVTATGLLGSFPYERKSSWRTFSVSTPQRVSPPRLLYPLTGRRASRLLLMKSKFLFAWSFKKPGARFHLEMAKDRAFIEIAGEERTTAAKVSPDFSLPVGRYYWRVSANLDNRERPLRSEIRSIDIIDHEPIRLDEPPDRHVLYRAVNKKSARIQFSWQGGVPGEYRLEISKSKKFLQKLHSTVIHANHYSVKGLSSGRYYWRVFNIDDQGKGFEQSRPATFDIVATLQRPVLISPQKDMTINMAKRDRLRFIWKEVPGADFYIVSVFFKNPRNRQLVFRKKVKASVYVLRNLSLLREGVFSWRVTPYSKHPGLQEKAVVGPVSEYYFSLTLGGPLAKPKILSPSLQYGDKL